MATPGPVAIAGALRRRPAVVWWAAAGVLFLAIQGFAYGSWIFGGNLTPVDPGPTPVPGYMRFFATFWHVIGPPIFVLMIYRLLVRPWRRERRLTVDGMIFIGILSLYWQDLLADYFSNWIVYNAGIMNRGAWFAGLPFWQAPSGYRHVEPFLAVVPMYAYGMFGAAVVVSAGMRRAKRRWPQLNAAGLLAIAFLCALAVDIVIEPLCWVPLGLYIYPGAIRAVSIFPNTYHQFPVYEAVLASFLFAGWGAIRYFVNDRGETLAERGINQLKVKGKTRTTVRLLAVIGILNVLEIVVYNAPIAVIAKWSDPYPQDVLKRSYFNYLAPNAADVDYRYGAGRELLNGGRPLE